MAFIKAVKSEYFESNSYKVMSILAKKIGIIKKEDGTFYAIEVNCKHQGANLLQNGLPKNGKKVKCHRHGWLYDLETGKCLTEDNPYSDLKMFDLKVEGEWIYINPHKQINITR